MDYITAARAAQLWNISQRRVQILCADGRIEGAVKFGENWAIPKNAKKPNDSREKKNKFKVLDLFSGAGGLSRGFLDAGYDVILGVDFDKKALETFKKNHVGSEVMQLDLFKHENIAEIENFLNKKNYQIDVLIGGPPCQGFSLAGPRNINDKRNTLYTAMVEVAARLKPQAVILENVPGLLLLNNGNAAKRIVQDFSELGYNMTAKILYAPDFGVPQIRKRVFFVGLLNSEKSFEFPLPMFHPKIMLLVKKQLEICPH